MALTQIVLDRQASGRVFTFGGSGAGLEAVLTIEKGTEAASHVALDVKSSANIGGDLNLTGNLNITGAINETSVTNLAVTDLTIRVNKGGTTAGAAAAGLQVEGDSAALIGALTFNNALASKFSIGDGATQKEIADVSSTQTLSGKTLTTPTIASFTNAAHDHTNAAGGGQLTDAALSAAVGVAKGGSGAATFTAGILKASGTSAFTTVAAPTGAVVGTSDVQTLTSKTLTAPRIDQINGTTNNLALVKFVDVVTAVNEVTITNAAAASSPIVEATGADTNIDLLLVAKGGGVVKAGGLEVTTISGTQTLTNKTLTTPTIASFANANHNHTNSAGGGQLTDAALSAAVTPAKGGTGLTTLTANNVILGNGTSSVLFVAPSTSGNVLTSNGTTWTSATPGAPSQYTRATAASGTQDGANKVFAIASAVTADTEIITVNGQVLNPGSGNDYVLAGTVLTFQAAFPAPVSTDVIRAMGMY